MTPMGCTLNGASSPGSPPAERSLPPRATAPPPPPFANWETTATEVSASSPASLVGAVFAGLGTSSRKVAAEAAREALGFAMTSLAAASEEGISLAPSLAIVACGRNVGDAEEVRCQLVRAIPDVLLQGASLVPSVFTSCAQPLGTSCSRPLANAVGCLLLQAPEGSYAAAWDDTGDAIGAAKWLQEQMPQVQAIIMTAVPGSEEAARRGVQLVFPLVPVYGWSSADATNWSTLSHLGSSERGISLVGICVHVGFGAAEVPCDSSLDFATSFEKAYEGAMAAGNLDTAAAGILTCRGKGADMSAAVTLSANACHIPMLGVACAERSDARGSSIAIMLFGKRRPPAELSNGESSKNVPGFDESTTSGSTDRPEGPATDAPESPSDAGKSPTSELSMDWIVEC